MKKFIIVLVILICGACASNKHKPTPNQNELIGVVLESHDNSLLLIGDEGLITIPSETTYKVGEKLSILYSGGIMESYPAQLGSVDKIESMGMDETKVHLVLKILEEPTDNIKDRGFDITGLTDIEKNALIYLMSQNNANSHIGSVDVLIDQGIINKDGHFVNGIHYTINLTDDTYEVNQYVTPQDTVLTKGTFDKADGIYIITEN